MELLTVDILPYLFQDEFESKMDIGIDLQSTNTLVTLFLSRCRKTTYSYSCERHFSNSTADCQRYRPQHTTWTTVETESTLALRELAIAID
jgi:hypothetical protein